ncbi:MAG: FecR domain-containing protein [Chloroflexi bacterium]|nr:FecR domain-containing protein [Chloroflexota bacterium]
MSLKKYARWIVLALLIVLPMSASRVQVQAGDSPQQADYVASLEPIQGLIQHQTAQDDPQDRTSWRTINEIIPVSEGDRIRTAQAGRAYLTFFEGIEVEIDDNTLIVVSTMLPPQDEQAAFSLTLDVLVGTVIVDAQQALSQGDRLEIYTPGATAAVRGTRWWVAVTPLGETVFAVERGLVEIIPHEREPIIEQAVGAAAAPAEQEDSAGGAAAVPGPETDNPPAAAAAFEEFLELSPGMGLLTDRYGAVLEQQQDIQFPAVRSRAPELPLALASCGDGICADDENAAICAPDCVLNLATCGNTICEPEQGEDMLLCAADCGPWAGDSCGNAICDPDESGLTCAADCAPDDYFDPINPAQCGNALCDSTESALSCPEDCALSFQDQDDACEGDDCEDSAGTDPLDDTVENEDYDTAEAEEPVEIEELEAPEDPQEPDRTDEPDEPDEPDQPEEEDEPDEDQTES